jgi:guanine deaminase
MDCNSPPDYVETTEESLGSTQAMIDYIRQKDRSGLILPVVTPRFALTCSRQAIKGLAGLASASGAHIQSHLSENQEEVEFAGKLFPECANYAAIYEAAGLLGPRTFLAHCVHLTEAQLAILAQHRVAVAHCPTSNFALNSGIASVRAMLGAGLRVGLGSDVSGGYGLSILDAMRQAVIASKARHFDDPSTAPLTVHEVFYLATLGGAAALSLDHLIGSFAPGKAFDALLIDMRRCPIPRHPGESLENCLQRLVFLGDDRWITKVYVNGCHCDDL